MTRRTSSPTRKWGGSKPAHVKRRVLLHEAVVIRRISARRRKWVQGSRQINLRAFRFAGLASQGGPAQDDKPRNPPHAPCPHAARRGLLHEVDVVGRRDAPHEVGPDQPTLYVEYSRMRSS